MRRKSESAWAARRDDRKNVDRRDWAPAMVRTRPRGQSRRAALRPRASRALSFANTRIGGGQQQIADKRAEREKERPHRRASGNEIDVAGAKRVVHQPAEPRARRDVLDNARSGQQRAD